MNGSSRPGSRPRSLLWQLSTLAKIDDDAGFFTRQHAAKAAQLVTMTDKQFEEMLADERELRELLTSSLVKPAQRSAHGSGSTQAK